VTLRAAYLRLGSALLALAAGAAGVIVVIALLRSEPGPIGSTPTITGAPAPVPPSSLLGGEIPTPDQPGFPAPPPGALVLAREAGPDALGFAIVPGKRRSLVRVSVVSSAGPGAGGLDVAVSFGRGRALPLSACGAGCYQAELAAGASPRVSVKLGKRSYGFSLPARRSLPVAAGIVTRATKAWRALKTLVWHERLAASPTDVIHTVYKAVAPDELSYTIAGLSSAVIIGGTRWDRSTPTGPWLRSVQDPPITVPVPFWYGVTDARVLGSTRFEGRSVWTVSFFDPTTAAWFEAEIDKQSSRTLELWMTAASHFMHHIYGPFNAPIELNAPAGSR